MDIVMPKQPAQNAIHPIEIFKQAWEHCWKNLSKLSAIYLIFNLPLTLLSLHPAINSLTNQKPGLLSSLWLLLVVAISSWGHIALLLSAKNAVDLEDYTIGHNIIQAKGFLIKYLALVSAVGLCVMAGIMVWGGVFVAALKLLPQVNMTLAILACCLLVIAVIAALVFFTLRWSLGTPVCVLENAWPPAALKGSFALVKKHINPVVGVYGLVGLGYIVFFIPVMIAEGSATLNRTPILATQTGMTIYITLLSIVLAPFWTMITIVLYKKLKEVL
jgi:hypothetical protein